MRLAFIADGRSSHTQRWLSYFACREHEIHLLSTYPCPHEGLPRVTIHHIHLWLRSADTSQVKNPLGNTIKTNPQERLSRLVRLLNFDTVIRPIWERWIALEVWHIAAAARRILKALRPDLVHALRIPIEGYVAALAGYHPLIVSSWGSDFTYWRKMNILHRRLTDNTLETADAFIADCERDRRFALRFLNDHATTMCPGNGGVRLDLIQRRGDGQDIREMWGIKEDVNVVLYNRGIGGPFYRFETFVKAIPLILGKEPNTVFLVLGGLSNPRAQRLVRSVRRNVRLLPYMRHIDLMRVLKESHVMVSPSMHDGTSNSMLEAMACNCLPIMSDLESTREWIKHGFNGFLFDSKDPYALGQCIVQGLRERALRRSAAKFNRELIRRRADYFKCMAGIESLYRHVCDEYALHKYLEPIRQG